MDALGAVHKQLNGRGVLDVLDARTGGRHVQRREQPHCLTGQPSGSRLVARICTLGQELRIATTSAPHALARCSQLSRMTSARAFFSRA